MRRLAEFAVIFSTLAAIVSTFFLYRTQSASPQMTATIIQSQETFLDNTNDTVSIPVDTSTTTETTLHTISTETSPATTAPEPILSEKIITIEKLPITEEEITTLTNRIQSLTNLSRSQNNLPPLTLNTTLSEVAKRRSTEMIEKNYFSHTSPSGCDMTCQLKASNYETLSWGENLALSNTFRSYTLPDLAQTFMTNWLKSSTHRDNILSKKFTHQGIGIAVEGERIVITVIFSS